MDAIVPLFKRLAKLRLWMDAYWFHDLMKSGRRRKPLLEQRRDAVWFRFKKQRSKWWLTAKRGRASARDQFVEQFRPALHVM